VYNLKHETTISDSDIINRVIQGESALFELLIRKNNPFLYKTGRSYGLNHHDTQDLMQEAFIAAYMNLQKFQQRSSFKTWIVQIMLNLCYRRTHKLSFRNEKPGNLLLTEKTTPVFMSDQHNDAYQNTISRELIHAIETALLNIPVEYRMVFSLRELNGMNTSETAEALAISETNVKVRLNRAKHMLRKKIETMYSPGDIFEFNLVYCDKVTHNVMAAIGAWPPARK
jgi:RNA polymerase sigma-70 factor (ECF subfamily)